MLASKSFEEHIPRAHEYGAALDTTEFKLAGTGTLAGSKACSARYRRPWSHGWRFMDRKLSGSTDSQL